MARRRIMPVRRFDKGGLPIWLLVILLLVAMPVLIPIAMVQQVLHERWMRAAARWRSCPACGVVLGVEALGLANKRWQVYLAETHRDNPGIRFRLVRKVFAICTRYGAEWGYDEKAMNFPQIDTDEAGLEIRGVR